MIKVEKNLNHYKKIGNIEDIPTSPAFLCILHSYHSILLSQFIWTTPEHSCFGVPESEWFCNDGTLILYIHYHPTPNLKLEMKFLMDSVSWFNMQIVNLLVRTDFLHLLNCIL